MATRLVWMLAAACAVPTVAVLRARGDAALAGPSGWAQALAVGAGLALVAAAAATHDDGTLRRAMLAAGGAAWLAAEWASPGAPGAVLFTAGLVAAGAAVPLVLGATLAGAGAVRAPAVAAVLLAAAGAALRGPVAALAADPRDAGCPDCPRDLLAIASRPDLAESLARLGAWLALAACAAAILALLVGMVRSSPTVRRRLIAVAAPATAFAAATGTELWLSLRGAWPRPESAARISRRPRRLRHWPSARALGRCCCAAPAAPSRSPRPRSRPRAATRWRARSLRSSATGR